LLFVPLENDYANNYNSITVNYNDEQLEDQLVSSSRRTIDIVAVNDAPVLKMGEVVLGGAETVTLTVAKENPVSLNLNTFDIDARSSDGTTESSMAFRLAIIKANPKDTSKFAHFTVPANVSNCVTVQPSATTLGYIQFQAAQTPANAILHGISFTFPEGTYEMEFVAIDKGFVGVCPPGLVKDTTIYVLPDFRKTFGGEGTLPFNDNGPVKDRCNRVSRVVISFTADVNGSVIASVPAAVGAGVAFLSILGAVIYAKLRKPEDMDAWQALDGAMGTNMVSSQIHVTAGSTGQNTLYQGRS